MVELPVPHEHVIATEFEGGEGVLVDLNTKSYYQLNVTAMQVWRGLEKGLMLSDIVSEMTNNYDVTAERAAASVSKILNKFQANNLVQPRP